MPPLETLLVIVIVALVGAIFFVFFFARQGWSQASLTNTRIVELETDLSGAKDANADLELRLAVEREKASRIPNLEREVEEKATQLGTLSELKAAAEVQVAEKTALLIGKTDAEAKLSDRLSNRTLELESAQRNVAETRARLAALQEALDQERKQADEKIALLREAKEQMTAEFQLLAGNIMKLNSESFSKQNKEQIEAIITPFKERLVEFQQGVKDARTESLKDHATLVEHIRQLTDSSAKMTTETSSLTRALRGEAQTQGAWGEMILASILEKSGLREGEEYTAQQSQSTGDGQKVRPDVVVNLPGGQRIVIDSKLSLVAFDAYVNAATDAERKEAVARHMSSLRSHIKTLASKEYHAVAGSQIDYVIMFVPIEGALAVAIKEDPGLTAFAVENSVAIATPTTLMIALRTVANVWQVERRNRNAEAIASRAGRLYDKLCGFVEDMKALGGRLTQARTSYDDAIGKLSSGAGNLVQQVEQLKKLGAKTSKSLPRDMLDDNETAPPRALEDSLPS
jgi:DNA recombination protein RmuC